jgi:hypothetical protein
LQFVVPCQGLRVTHTCRDKQCRKNRSKSPGEEQSSIVSKLCIEGIILVGSTAVRKEENNWLFKEILTVTNYQNREMGVSQAESQF